MGSFVAICISPISHELSLSSMFAASIEAQKWLATDSSLLCQRFANYTSIIVSLFSPFCEYRDALASFAAITANFNAFNLSTMLPSWCAQEQWLWLKPNQFSNGVEQLNNYQEHCEWTYIARGQNWFLLQNTNLSYRSVSC